MSDFTIVADWREKSSGIPELLMGKVVEVSFAKLTVGDYQINNQITIERKSANDFVQSIIDNRLFVQCYQLKKCPGRILVLVEGNPYATGRRISEQAIRGALTAIMVSWQIPVIHTKNKEETAGLLIDLGKQSIFRSEFIRLRGGYKPKRTKSHLLAFLQGLPATGPTIAGRLISHYGNIKSVINATKDELKIIEGIGEKSAEKIIAFVTKNYY